VENNINKILQYKSRYQTIVEPLQIFWYFEGIIHSMESGRNFLRHLHNGDPLTGRTLIFPRKDQKQATLLSPGKKAQQMR